MRFASRYVRHRHAGSPAFLEAIEARVLLSSSPLTSLTTIPPTDSSSVAPLTVNAAAQTADTTSNSLVATVFDPLTTWMNHAFASQTGTFTAAFDVVAQANTNAVVGLSSAAAAQYPDLGAIVGFFPDGTLQARNGDNYMAQSTINYTAGNSYHFRMVVNLAQHTYDVYVTPQGGSEVAIGQGYSFRTEQAGAASLANYADIATAGGVAVSNFTVTPQQQATAPVAPSNLAMASSGSQINLTWNDNSNNETGFLIQRATNTTPWTTLAITNPNTTSYSDSSGAANTQYYYFVEALNGGMASNMSNIVTASAKSATPNAPSNLTATGATAQVNLAWTDNSNNETGFLIQRATSTTPWTTLAITSPNVTSYADTSAAPNTQYYYFVAALNGGVASTMSNIASATAKSGTLNAPSNLNATAASSTQVNLTWTDNSNNETGFKIERQTGSGSWTTLTTTGANATSYSDSSVSGGTQYNYRVSAVNGTGSSSVSNTASATTPPLATAPTAPSNLSATAASPTTVNLSWNDNSSNETGFRIERQTGSGSWTLLTTTAANATTFADTTVAAGTQYSYRVSATNGAGTSTTSNVATATTPSGSGSYVYQDANGWTVVTQAPEDQVIYVSSSTGSDSNNGLSASTPVKTISHAESLFTSGHPVWLLLKAGDTFNEGTYQWKWGGLSVDKPSLISSYGTGPRPVLKTGTDDGVYMNTGGGSPTSMSYVDVIGLNFYDSARDPNSPDFSSAAANSHSTGMMDLLPGQNILVEDCAFQYYGDNFAIEPASGRIANFTLRRSQVLGAYSTNTAHSQGIYIDNTDGVLIDGCTFDHNGWNATVSGAVPTIFNHNMYIQYDCTGVTVRGNISADASSHGIMDRPGGIVTGNLCINDPISISVGNGYGVDSQATQVTGNVILDGTTTVMQGSEALAWAIEVEVSNNPSTLIQGNIIANDDCPGTNVAGVEVNAVNNTVINNVVYNWRGGIADYTGTATIGSGQVNPSNLANPTITVASYMASIGKTGSDAAFLAGAGAQSHYAWNSAFSVSSILQYFQQGFAPPAPTGVGATPAGTTAATVTWNAVAGATAYLITRSTDGGNTWVQVAAPPANATTYQDTGLTTGTRYYYRVQAVNGIGASVASTMVQVQL